MCRKKKNSDREETVFGKGSRIFIGLLSAALVCLLIEIIYAATKMHEISGRLGGKESFLEILMRVLGFASSLYNINNSDEVPIRTGSQKRIGPLKCLKSVRLPDKEPPPPVRNNIVRNTVYTN